LSGGAAHVHSEDGYGNGRALGTSDGFQGSCHDIPRLPTHSFWYWLFGTAGVWNLTSFLIQKPRLCSTPGTQHLNFASQEPDCHTGIGPNIFSISPNEPFTSPVAVLHGSCRSRHPISLPVPRTLIPTTSSRALPNPRPIHSLFCRSNPAQWPQCHSEPFHVF